MFDLLPLFKILKRFFRFGASVQGFEKKKKEARFFIFFFFTCYDWNFFLFLVEIVFFSPYFDGMKMERRNIDA